MVKVERSFQVLKVDGNDVQLRVFVPEQTNDTKKPAVVMVCGLLWLGGGFMGMIGLNFNDAFGNAFARAGVSCVQVHTPNRHMAHTRIQDILCFLMLPLLFIPGIRFLICLLDGMLLATSLLELCVFVVTVLIVPSFLGGPFIHLAMRAFQWWQGGIPFPKHRSALREVEATRKWAKENKDLLRSNGELVLCGYSSGGHCASLHAFQKESPCYSHVVLISGIYDLRTAAWTGMRRYLAPLYNMVYSDIYGVTDEAARAAASPVALVPHKISGDWYVLSAKAELMGLAPFEDIFFGTAPLCNALEAAGAKVHKVTCGLNHWLLIFGIDNFIQPFCKSLGKDQAER
jgi:acetyl esterase/lipase